MLPNFVIIGAQKSASTFMQACLSDHPDIYMPLDEIPFFESPDYEENKVEELEKLFEGKNEQCLGIKRPTYIGLPEVPGRIQSHLPDAKLLAVLRNPIDRAASAYFHNVKYGFLPPVDIEIGMRQIIEDPSFNSKYKRASEIIEFGYYYKYLSKYNYYFENNQFLIFSHEEILAHPKKSIHSAYNFLGVFPDFIPSSLNSRPQKVLYNITRAKLLAYRNKFLYNYNENRTRLFPKTMTSYELFITRLLTNLDKRFLSLFLSNKKPKISKELRNILYNLYKNDIEALEKMLDRDFSAWKPNK